MTAMPGCAQNQNSGSSQQSSSASASVPAPTAEIADVTTIAYLGPAGTYTEEATKLFFGNNDELLPQKTVTDALACVADGTAAYTVIPQKNTLGGPVTIRRCQRSKQPRQRRLFPTLSDWR